MILKAEQAAEINKLLLMIPPDHGFLTIPVDHLMGLLGLPIPVETLQEQEAQTDALKSIQDALQFNGWSTGVFDSYHGPILKIS